MEIQEDDLTYDDLFLKFPDQSSESISGAYEAIEHLLTEAQIYFQVTSFIIRW